MRSPFFWRNAPPVALPRILRPADATVCARLHATSFAHAWSSAEFEALLADGACAGDGVDEKSTLIGFILSRRALDEAEILTVVVDPSARRKGCGQRLLGAHIARLAGSGVAHLFLEVDQQNAPALALYRRFGFAVVGERKHYYAQANGIRSNALVMRRALA